MTLGIIIVVAITAIIIVAMTYVYSLFRGWTKLIEKDGKINEFTKFYKEVM